MRARELDSALRMAEAGTRKVRIVFRPDANRLDAISLVAAFDCETVCASQHDLVRLCMDVFSRNWKANGYTLFIGLPASFDRAARDEFVTKMSRALKSAEVVN